MNIFDYSYSILGSGPPLGVSTNLYMLQVLNFYLISPLRMLDTAPPVTPPINLSAAARRKILTGGGDVAKIVGGGAASARRPCLDQGIKKSNLRRTH